MRHNYKIARAGIGCCLGMIMLCTTTSMAQQTKDKIVKSTKISMDGFVSFCRPPKSQVSKTMVDDNNQLYLVVFLTSESPKQVAAYYEKMFVSPTDNVSINYKKTHPHQGSYSMGKITTAYFNNEDQEVYSYVVINGVNTTVITVNKKNQKAIVCVTSQKKE